jgi:hypothetical protein
MQLTNVQKQPLYAHGYVQVSGVVPQVRYAIFFRLTHVDHAEYRWESMTNAWLEWEGMRDIVAADRNESNRGGV